MWDLWTGAFSLGVCHLGSTYKHDLAQPTSTQSFYSDDTLGNKTNGEAYRKWGGDDHEISGSEKTDKISF